MNTQQLQNSEQGWSVAFSPEDGLAVNLPDGTTHRRVKPVWSAPLSHPERYLALLDEKGKEIIMISDPNRLPKHVLTTLQEELRRRYLTAQVIQVQQARYEYGATYWTVDTDRGTRDFVTQQLQENAIWLGEGHLLLLDVDGNRFEIKEVKALDLRSQKLIGAIL